MKFMFNFSSQEQKAESIWADLMKGLSSDVTIKSTKEGKFYTIEYINEDELSFTSETRNKGLPETISKSDFIKVINCLKELPDFNTSSSKTCFSGTHIYQKRSPFFAILFSAGIIEKVN